MVFFTVGCNFKCEFCHNKYLLNLKVGKEYSISELLTLIKNNYLVSAISITGGEPTLQKDLLDFCIRASKLNKYISIDTNGSNPRVIESLIPHVNRFALDIKGPLEREQLKRITKVEIKPEVIIRSFELINEEKSLDFEVRTTYVENLHVPEDIDLILKFLESNYFEGNFVLQQYQYSEGVGMENKEMFESPYHGRLLEILKPYKDKTFPFQIFLRDDVVGYCKLENLFY